ncbi:2TM domain-containing protein [Actinotalea sp. M2MS4P-6]|uniref:2TM domain-containing protein n=1 Tax=Actinotalea sp. M2MS4P-6 TaxID=2983762 RepID=UPI0021E3BD03|nr:2TM domain-containing protein [Actinotalea sp. M2MS4P-6]MCV2393628.1 2TM domain-containing protein [Actinotalea sp. M2MS4P-6]
MATLHTTPSHHLEPELHVTRWVLIIVGAVAGLLGLVILVGGEDQYIGLGGDWSARVGDIAPGWGWGLLVAGGAALAAGVTVMITGRSREGAEHSARSDLVGHAIVFVLVNGFLWAQDLALGDGVNYAWWVTVPWAVGLGVHATTVLRRT